MAEETKIKISVDAPGTSQALGRIQGGFDGIGGSLKNVIAGAASFAKTLTAIGAAGGAALLGKAIKNTADFADGLSKAAQRVGTTVEALSALRHAADLSDVSFEDLQTGMAKLAKTSEDFRDGLSTAKDAFEKIKLDPRKFSDTSDLLTAVADRLSKMPDGARKTAIAMELFGKSGAKLIPLLNGGAEGMRKAREEAEQLGIVMTTEAAAAAEEFNDNMTRLGNAADGLKYQLGKTLLPAMQDISRAMADAAREGGLLNAIWVGLGATMAHILGIDEASKLQARLEQVSKKIETVTRQLASGSLNPQGASDRFFSFLVPDVQMNEKAKSRLRLALQDLQKQRDDILSAMQPAASADQRRVNTMVQESQLSAEAKEQEAARIKKALETQKRALDSAEKSFEAAKKKRIDDLKYFQDLQKQLSAPAAGTPANTIYGYQVEKAVDDARKANALALTAPSSQANQQAQAALDKAQAAGELLKQYKTQQEATGSSIDAKYAEQLVQRLGQDLMQIVDQASGVQEKLAQDQVAAAQGIIQSTLEQAEALKKLVIGFDTDAATRNLNDLMEQLRNNAQANPVAVPVIAVNAADAANFTGVTDNQGRPIYRDPTGYASGGMIQGPGSDTSDNILAWLSPGEYVVRAAAVRKYGRDRLAAINNFHLPKYANGGAVGRVRMARLDPVTASDTTQRLHPVTINFPGFGQASFMADSDFEKQMRGVMAKLVLQYGKGS